MRSLRHLLTLLLLTVLACGQSLVDYPEDNGPTVVSTQPDNASTGIATNTRVTAVFSTAMDAKTLTPSTFTLTLDGTTVPGAVTYSGVTATFTPTDALSPTSTYAAAVTSGAKDTSGRGLASTYAWGFTTGRAPDFSAPTVTFTFPESDAAGVFVSSLVRVGFSETMDCSTLGPSTFTLTQAGTPVLGAVTCIGGAVTLTPASPLLINRAYTATVTTDAQDLAGNALAADYVWNFTTSDATDMSAPFVTFTDPTSDASGVVVDVTVHAAFNETMDCATLDVTSFTLTQAGNPILGSVGCFGSAASFAPMSSLDENTVYTATITTAVKDPAGNALAADYVWDFTTRDVDDVTPPVVTFTVPTADAIGVDVNTTVYVAFDELMDCSTFDVLTFTLTQGGAPVLGSVACSGQTAMFTPMLSLSNNTAYVATVTTGAQDLSGNGLVADYAWTFLTGPLAAQGAVDLGVASTYAILAFDTVTNVNNPGTVVTGDLGISPGAALVGFPPGQIVGATHLADATAASAKAALLTAYNDAAGRLGAAVLPGDLSGLTFAPGLYKNSTSVMIAAGNLTLDAFGDVNAVFIFQMGSTLTTMPGTQVILAGGAKATNIYWAVGTSATLGTTSVFKGTILAASAITMLTGASIEGRLLAQAAAVDLDTNLITVPGP